MRFYSAILRELMAAGLSGDALFEAFERIERFAPKTARKPSGKRGSASARRGKSGVPDATSLSERGKGAREREENEHGQKDGLPRQTRGEQSSNRTKTILFLCTGNYYRGRFAEELFNHHAKRAGLAWRAQSRALAVERLAGVSDRMSPLAVRGLKERGFIASAVDRIPQQCESTDFEKADYIVALNEPEHRPIIIEHFPHWAEQIEYWMIGDADVQPWAVALAAIDEKVDALVRRFGGKPSSPALT